MSALQTQELSEASVAEFGNAVIPECTVYQHENFNLNDGDNDGFVYRTTLRISYVGDDMNDQISSVVVHSGIWRFYRHIDFGGDFFDLAPGNHRNVPEGWNDQISSYEPISW